MVNEMQQRAMGPNGTYTDDQKKRAILYSFSLVSSAVDDSEENKKLYETLLNDVNEIPRKGD
jgi:hypothetical protein